MPLLARDLMQKEPVTVTANATFLEIQHLFVVAQISGAPVVDHDERVVGVISASDLLRVADQAFDDEIDPEPADTTETSGLPEHLESLTASDIASPDAIWVSPDTPIFEVAQLMRRESVHRVLVGSNGQLAGILTTFDLLSAVSQ